MSKATITPTETRAQELKTPKTVMVREVVPWFIVTIMTFAVAGTVTGWFIHANVAASNRAVIAAASKDGQ